MARCSSEASATCSTRWPSSPASATRRPRAPGLALEPELQQLLDAIGAGHSTLPMLASNGLDPRAVLAGLGELEGLGLIRRGFGGRYERVP